MESAELRRVIEDAERTKNWKRWGPYLSERQWGTVREDYSANGDAWASFPHDHARSRAYRWGEDGMLGWTDRQSRLCFALALWNGRDSILKERLYGLTNSQGNHGEDVKECYYYLDATPTASYAKALYKYPQAAFPYETLIAENAKRGRDQLEFELEDTGIFDGNRYFDVFVEYAKAGPDDTYIQITIANRGPESARLDVLPTLWFRNTWSWGCKHEGCTLKPRMWKTGPRRVATAHESLHDFEWLTARKPDAWLFTDNETNTDRLYRQPNPAPWVKDAFHRHVIDGEEGAVNPNFRGTKAAAHYRLEIPAGGEVTLQLQLRERLEEGGEFDPERFDRVLAKRRRDADDFYAELIPGNINAEQNRVARQAYAGLVWSKQFYHYVLSDWINGDPYEPAPPPGRELIRNGQWSHFFARDVLSMPDKWEYPWFAAWDLAFHMVPFARIDPIFAKQQLSVLLREWYMHPNGQMPAYEWEFGDVNPPVHAWAAWRVYKIADARGFRDRGFLESTFQKLLLNFTWWVNRKDQLGQNLFSGGFLGLDNIGVFDRSRPLPGGGQLHQADGTAWMGFYCVTMLAMALELAKENPVYQDMASKFFEHFIAIADALNHFDGTGLWNEEDGFYYDHLRMNGTRHVLKTRSMVGLIPVLAVEILDLAEVQKLTGFSRRMEWFLLNRPDLARHMSWCDRSSDQKISLLALPSRERLARILARVLDEEEFLSPHGIRSLSAAHGKAPFTFEVAGEKFSVGYNPGESTSGMFGGNSNWRGPVWFPINYLLIEALERYHRYYGADFKVECPRGSGNLLNLNEVADFISCRLTSLFTPDATGARPCHGGDPRYANDPHWKDLVLFHEYFHGDTGRGLGASHQTGWTALVTRCIEDLAQADAKTRLAAQIMNLHVLQHDPIEGPGIIADWAATQGHSVSVTHLYRGESLPDPTAADALVIMGGPMNIYQDRDHPWLRAERVFIATHVAVGKPAVGICLGSQFLADALGARVIQNPHVEIGWFPVAFTAEARAAVPALPAQLNVLHWHGDTFELPAGAIPLATSAACANQGFLFENRILALQFHPEITRPIAAALIAAEPLTTSTFVQTGEAILARSDADFTRPHATLFALLATLLPAR